MSVRTRNDCACILDVMNYRPVLEGILVSWFGLSGCNNVMLLVFISLFALSSSLSLCLFSWKGGLAAQKLGNLQIRALRLPVTQKFGIIRPQKEECIYV